MLPGTEMRDDRALEGRALREVIDLRSDAVEDEAQDVRVAVVAVAEEREAAPEANDVRLWCEIVGELRIEEPRRAERDPRGSLRKVTREERSRLREGVITGFGPSAMAGGPTNPSVYLTNLGVRKKIVYQPAERYTKFQWIEFGLFTGLAAGCALLTIVWVRRRDA